MDCCGIPLLVEPLEAERFDTTSKDLTSSASSSSFGNVSKKSMKYMEQVLESLIAKTVQSAKVFNRQSF